MVSAFRYHSLSTFQLAICADERCGLTVEGLMRQRKFEEDNVKRRGGKKNLKLIP